MFWRHKVFSYLNTAVKILYLFPKQNKTEVLGGGNKEMQSGGLNKRQFTKELIFSKTSNVFQ